MQVELGRTLAAWRARADPAAADIRLGGNERRRVPGLRREEVAALAQVSVSYYTRIEQGQSGAVSPEVLGAIARALGASDVERAHLLALAARPGRRRSGPRPLDLRERTDPSLAHLLANLAQVPALVLSRRFDILASNALAVGLFDLTPPADGSLRAGRRLNFAEAMFLDPRLRRLYEDWHSRARAVAGSLRIAVAAHPDDIELAQLIDSLETTSAEFATLWASHGVESCATAVVRMNHPGLGELHLVQQVLQSSTGSGQLLLTLTADPGSASALSLQALSDLASPTPLRAS